MFRRVVAMALSSAALLILTACSPATIGYVALQRADDGAISAVVVMCQDGLGPLRLTRSGGAETPEAGAASAPMDQESWEFEPEVSGISEIELDGAETFITSGRYSLQGAGEKKYGLMTHSWDGRVEGPTNFTSDDLDTIAASEVLALNPRTLELRAFDRDEFENDACR